MAALQAVGGQEIGHQVGINLNPYVEVKHRLDYTRNCRAVALG